LLSVVTMRTVCRRAAAGPRVSPGAEAVGYAGDSRRNPWTTP
jgi:hypothetical protein